MADTPNDALEVKHSEPPLRATRRRLLQGMGSSIALSLAGCGYGFVAPRTSAADPFTIQMGNQEQLILQFCDRLFSDGALQKSFIADPIRTMRANGAIPELSNVAIDRVNVLLLYMIGNQSLLYKLQAIAEKHSAASNTLNSFTLANVNVDVAEKAQNAFHTDADVQAMLGEQIEVLVWTCSAFADSLRLEV